MFLSAVLFVLFLAGCWLYCLTDAALTPAAELPGLRKPAWITAIAVTFILGAIAWIIARKLRRARRGHQAATNAGPLATAAGGGHPAALPRDRPRPAVPIGPDDDPEFLRMLDRLISGTSDPGELSPGLAAVQ
jgi:hypothetical protein